MEKQSEPIKIKTDALDGLSTYRQPDTGNIRLSAFEDEEISLLLGLFNEPEASGFYIPTLARPYSLAQLKALLATWDDRSEAYMFAIRDGDELVGVVNIEGINWVNRNAEIGIALAGPGQRGKGYASRALRLFLSYLFREAGLHRVFCRIMEGNESSMRLFERAGFRSEGIMRQHVFRGGTWLDLHMFGLMADEWIDTGTAPDD